MRDRLRTWRLTHAALALILIGSAAPLGCSREPATPDAALGRPAPNASPTENLPFPHLVLDGTDLTNVTAFPDRPIADIRPGQYRCEQGGAELFATLTRAASVWSLRRTYEEPGDPGQTVERTLQPVPTGLASTQRDLYLRLTSEGLLLLELNSGLEGIPPTHWILYRSSP